MCLWECIARASFSFGSDCACMMHRVLSELFSTAFSSRRAHRDQLRCSTPCVSCAPHTLFSFFCACLLLLCPCSTQHKQSETHTDGGLSGSCSALISKHPLKTLRITHTMQTNTQSKNAQVAATEAAMVEVTVALEGAWQADTVGATGAMVSG